MSTKRDLNASNLIEGCDESLLDIYFILYELYITTFKWLNMPTEINVRKVEKMLVETGHVFFFNDPDLSEDGQPYYLMLTGALSGLDHYGEPTNIDIITPSASVFPNMNIKKDGVLVRNTFGGYPPQRRLMYYAKRIYNLERTIDINVYAQRYPIVGQGTQQAVNNILAFMERVDQDQPLIIVDNDFDLDSLKTVDFNAPFVGDQLMEIKRKVWSEALSFIGIENNASEKKERLTDDEVIVSNGMSIAFRNNRKLARMEGIDAINERFGLDIQLEANPLEQSAMVNDDDLKSDDPISEEGEQDA